MAINTINACRMQFVKACHGRRIDIVQYIDISYMHSIYCCLLCYEFCIREKYLADEKTFIHKYANILVCAYLHTHRVTQASGYLKHTLSYQR
jgi:hypothetical protein